MRSQQIPAHFMCYYSMYYGKLCSRDRDSVLHPKGKPDIAAPGVSILAAYPPTSVTEDGFAFDSGTSMACPHVAGIAALIKSLHKDWSPAAIKSAIVTTASQTGTDGEMIAAEGGNRKPADPFDIGRGLINPNKATDPGLIYDMSMGDYVQFLCSMGYKSSAISKVFAEATSCSKNRHSMLNLNLPSISIPNLTKTITILRTVTNVGPTNSVYKALVQPPHGIKVAVKPEILSFNSSITTIQFRMTFSSTRKVQGDYSFGSLTWTDGEHFVRSPIVVSAVKFELYADM
ncbi:subtilisin-like protease SBT3.10 [Tasmannia lanceolata]|uniref:subtilisin-like protease SBT3.10 n=1 Tax=Tasmannia lanceolata TaxID=3420 RepID=UPI0040630EC1